MAIDFTPAPDTSTDPSQSTAPAQGAQAAPTAPTTPSAPIDFTPAQAPAGSPAISFTPATPPQGAPGISFQAASGGDNPDNAVQRELDNRSFFNRPAIGAEETKPEDIQAIAAKHGVDPEQLLQLAPYFGARLPSETLTNSEAMKRAVGTAGSVALGIPQKIYKMAQSPEMERALDDVQALASGRESYLGLGGQMAAPILPGVGAGASLGAKVLHGAAIGTVAGAAGSRQNQMVEGAGAGAALGGTIGLVADKLLSRASTPTEKAAVTDTLRTAAPDIDKGTQDILDRQSQSLQTIQDQIIGQGEDLDDDAVNRILDQQLAPSILDPKLDMATEEGQLYRQRAIEQDPQLVQEIGPERATERLVAQDVIDQKAQDFAEFLTGKTPKTVDEAQAAIEEYSSRQGGADALADRWDNFTTQQAGEEYLQNSHIRPGRENNFANKMLNNISDAQFAIRDIDNRTHLGLEPIHNELNTNYNRMTMARQGFQEDLNNIFRGAQKTGVDDTVVNSPKLFEAIDSGNFSGLSPQEVTVANQFKDYFDKGLNFTNNLVREKDPSITPLSIPARENYVPYQIKPVRELAETIQSKLEQVPGIANVTDPKQFAALAQSNPQLSDVLEGMSRLDASGAPKSGPELMSKVYDLFQTREGRNALETQAKAAMERTENPLPMWMRETNLYKLADNWTTSTLKHLYLRDPIEKMAGKAKLLGKAGATLEQNYIQTLLTDMQGIRQGTMASFTSSAGDKWSQGIDRLVNGSNVPGVQVAGGIAKAVPSILADATRNIYANVLGLSMHANILHILHPIAKTLPEIGLTPYGSFSLLKGTVNALLNFSDQYAKVHNMGLIPAEMVPQFRQAIEEGIRRNAAYAIPMNVMGKLSEYSLYTFRKLDIMNRMVTNSMAEGIIADLGAGSKAAEAALGRMPQDIQRYVRGAADQGEATQRLSAYLNASTQYNYNRASLSEFGRTMGPFFSTFTKWPTATAGEIISEYRDKGLLQGSARTAEKFLGPLLIFKGADALIKSTIGENGEFTDRQKMMLGHGGMADAAPLGSIGSIATGKLFAPPAVDAILRGIVTPIKEGNAAKARGALIGTLQEFTPGSVYVRFITDDLVTYIKGERPEGSNFLERTESGAQTLNRMGNK